MTGDNTMDKKSKSLYEAKENQIMDQSASFVEFLTKMGVLEDCQIDDALVRKAKKSTAQKAFHNTKVLLEHFRTICWVLESVPGELAEELNVPTKNLDILAAKIDLQTTLENKKLENRLNAAMKTRILVGRVYDALSILRKKPGNGEKLYSLIYATYLDPVVRNHQDLIDHLQISTRSYYRLRREAITIISIHLWSAPSSGLDAWLEVLTILEGI